NYSYFIEKRTQLLAEVDSSTITIKNAQSSKPRIKTLNKLKKQKEAEERNRLYRQNKDILDRLKSVEEEIKVLEENKANVESQLCNPTILKNSKKVQNLMINLKKINQELATLTRTRDGLILKINEI
ncbi:MAG: hypothetical protein B7C24_13710, partial [Bacteroidetes bacterium 4572_77]